MLSRRYFNFWSKQNKSKCKSKCLNTKGLHISLYLRTIGQLYSISVALAEGYIRIITPIINSWAPGVLQRYGNDHRMATNGSDYFNPKMLFSMSLLPGGWRQETIKFSPHTYSISEIFHLHVKFLFIFLPLFFIFFYGWTTQYP